ncbi:MAG: HNH endonuclease signature motif containing protein [Bacteroidales bacterium]
MHSEEFKKRMSEMRKGKNNPAYGSKYRWKGGELLSSSGYKLIYCPGHPSYKRKHVYEHRLVMEKHLGRYLRSQEVIHHINGVKTDNRIENLLLMTHSEHRHKHAVNNSKWSDKFDRCIRCHSSNNKHNAKGLCTRCYQYAKRHSVFYPSL